MQKEKEKTLIKCEWSPGSLYVVYKCIVHYIIPDGFPASVCTIPKLDTSVQEVHSKSSSISHKDQKLSMNNVMTVGYPSNLKAFTCTLCGKKKTSIFS